MAILWKGCKSVNFELHNSQISLQIFEMSVPILLNVSLSLNQTLLTFLLYVRQTWMTQMINWQFLCERLSSFKPLSHSKGCWSKGLSERILLLMCMVLQFIWRKNSPLHRTYLYKTFQILTNVSNSVYFIQYLASFSFPDKMSSCTVFDAISDPSWEAC